MEIKTPPRKTKIFVSYKTGAKDGMTFAANIVKKALDDAGYDVWMDVEDLQAGQNWNDQIYERIRTSDVLLLILGSTTIGSDWVRREIDVAKGSGVTILPVLIRDDFDKQDTLEKFDIPRVQYVDLLIGDETQFKKLVTELKGIQGQTLKRQKEWIEQRLQDEKGTPFEKADQNVEYYAMQNLDNVDHPVYNNLVIHIAAGDMTEMQDIDVLVNSENDYMQMGRIFESKTVSSLLRYHGSLIDKAGRLVEDTVQNELDCRIALDKDLQKRPFGVSTVIPTSAGHPESNLVKNNHARYIFHAAAVSVEDGEKGKYLQPILQDSGLRRCVKNTLDKVLELNAAKGNIWPKDTDEYKQDQIKSKDYQPITSILIPMFGSGRGGRDTKDVIPPIVHGVHEFLVDMTEDPAKKFTLTDIYLCVYHHEDVEPLQQALAKSFRKLNESEYQDRLKNKPVMEAKVISNDGVQKVVPIGEQEHIEIALTETPQENGKSKPKEKKPQSSTS